MKLSWRGIYIAILCSLVLLGLYCMLDTGNKSQTDAERSRRIFETLVQDKLDPSHIYSSLFKETMHQNLSIRSKTDTSEYKQVLLNTINQKNVLLELYKQQVEMQHAEIHHAHVQKNVLPGIHEQQAVASDTHMAHNLADTHVRHDVIPYTHMQQIDSMLLEDKTTLDVLNNEPDTPTNTNTISKPNNYYQQEYLKLANEYIVHDPRVPIEDKNKSYEDLRKKMSSVLNYTEKEIYSMIEYIRTMNERIDLTDLTPKPDFDLVQCDESTVTPKTEDLLCMVSRPDFLANNCTYSSARKLKYNVSSTTTKLINDTPMNAQQMCAHLCNLVEDNAGCGSRAVPCNNIWTFS